MAPILSAQDIADIRRTWVPFQNDLKGHGIKFMVHFLEGYPHYQKLFRGFADLPMSELPANKIFQAHSFSVLQGINGLVVNIDDADMVNELHVKNGHNHGRRDLGHPDFKNVKVSVLQYLERHLGSQWTPQVKDAWARGLDILVEKNSEGSQIYQQTK